MNKTLKIMLAAALMMAMLLTGCTRNNNNNTVPPQDDTLTVEGLATIHETEFGGVYLQITIDDFNKLGFEYGDSIDLTFSNGYKLPDIPYYNGYYVDAGEALLIAYPGYDYIKAAINYGDDLWERAQLEAAPGKEESLWKTALLDEHSTATITLKEKGKYRDVQEARDIHYEDDRTKFPSDEVFANFRYVTMGSIKEKTLYRSASPCDNQHQRAPYVDALMQQAGVRCILNLSDNDTKIAGYIAKDDFNSPYFLSLYNDDKVIPIALNMNYLSEEFARKIANGFIAMIEKEGPYLVHCTEGKDRTGFVIMLLEALAGAPYQQIADDYMLTYDNYYKINPEKEPAKYRTILEKNLDAMLKFVVHDDKADFKTVELAPYARKYLVNSGMSDVQVDRLLARLGGN